MFFLESSVTDFDLVESKIGEHFFWNFLLHTFQITHLLGQKKKLASFGGGEGICMSISSTGPRIWFRLRKFRKKIPRVRLDSTCSSERCPMGNKVKKKQS